MIAVVADASALLELVLGGDRSRPFDDVIGSPETDLHVPALCDIEVAAGLRRALGSRQISVGRASEALVDFCDLPLTRHGHQTLLPRILELRDNFTAYDAAYVALTEGLEAQLLTADQRLARTVRAHTDLVVLP
ncbi:MAG: type II toxin-antitoxin system VapC family toxin [Actinomycetota bacterium]